MTEGADRFLRLATVLDRTGLSRTTLYRMVRAGTFPEQVRIGLRCSAWRESSVLEWQRSPCDFARSFEGASPSPEYRKP